MEPTQTSDRWTGWELRLAAGVAVTVVAVLSQYVVPVSSPVVRLVYGTLVGDLLVVYGVPIAAFVLLLGLDPLRDWARRTGRAAVVGLGWYGAMSLLGIGVTIVLAIVYAIADPGALKLLGRENPALRQAAGDPWLFVGLSFLVGACEETIFRGWFFGTWVRRTGRWFLPAVVSSAVFAGVHLYYGLTFGIASPFYYEQLFLLGFAFAATYHAAGGNLLVPILLHGANDAIAFVSLVSPGAEVAAHFGLIGVGAVVGLVYLVRTEGREPPTVVSVNPLVPPPNWLAPSPGPSPSSEPPGSAGP